MEAISFNYYSLLFALSILVIFLSFSSNQARQNTWLKKYDLNKVGVIVVPVADMLVAPAGSPDIYKKLPFTTDKHLNMLTPRVHQCLYNELIFDLQELKNEYSGNVPNAYYGVDNQGNWINQFFTYKDCVIPLAKLKERGIDLSLIAFYNGDRTGDSKVAQDTLVLIKPWFDKHTQKWYSVGTRFVYNPERDTPHAYTIHFIDYHNYRSLCAQIPRSHALVIKNLPKNEKQKKQLFITLIRSWINEAAQAGGRLAYVLGGSSFSYAYTPLALNVLEAVYSMDTSLNAKNTCNRFLHSWLPENPHYATWTGFDCSELIWRAANSVDFDYPYKNTHMISLFLKPIKTNRVGELSVGDLLWIPGHVLIISDIAKGLVIEAAGYMWPVGKVHETRLSDIFKNIKNYDDLLKAYNQNNSLVRFGSSGREVIYDTYKIFRFSSNKIFLDNKRGNKP